MTTLRTFEGRELEQLLDHVQAECGPDATIVSANRVRKGGVKGFFATEVFELTVEDPSGASSAGAADDLVEEPIDEVDPREREQRFAAALAAAVEGFEDAHESHRDQDPGEALVPPSSSAQALLARSAGVPVAAMSVSSAMAASLGPPPATAIGVTGSTTTSVVDEVDSPPARRPSASAGRATEARPVPRRRPPARPVTPAASEPENPTLWQLLERYASLPTLAERPPPGVTVVVGAADHVVVAAPGVAVRSGLDAAQVLVASPELLPAIVPWQWVGSAQEAAERVAAQLARAGGRARPRLVLAVVCGSDEESRRWADGVIEAVEAVRRHVVVAARADEAQAGELLARFDGDALDLVGLDDAAAPDELCRLGLPVTTLEGHPASPALWAALTIERSCRVPA